MIRPATILPPGNTHEPRIDRLVNVLLPQPDSPTRPRNPPSRDAEVTPSTALTTPSLVMNWFFSPSTLSSTFCADGP